MDIEVKLDESYSTPKIIICANKVDDDISKIIDCLSNINHTQLKAYKDDKLFILNQSDIESIYSENGKIYARCAKNVFNIKLRLYETESILDKKMFIRISNSEIVNFKMVSNIDFKFTGTIVINFKSGNTSYVSRRYIPKIKEFLDI